MPEIDQGIHLDFRPQIEAAAESLAAAYPRVEFEGVKLFESAGDKSLGYAQDGWINLNAAWFAAPRAAFDDQVTQSRAMIPVNAPPWHGHIGELKGEVDRLMAHEFGHLLAQGLEGYEEFAREGHNTAIAYPSVAVAGYCLLAGEHPDAADEWWAETFAALRVGGSGSVQVGDLAAFLTRDEDAEDLPEIYARQDDAWDEAAHPRVPKGSEGGGQFAKKGQVSTNVAEPLAAHKFKVAKGPAGSTVASYTHEESGLTVTITAPPSDKKYSSGWQIKYSTGETVEGQGGKALLAKLNAQLGAASIKSPAKVEAAAEKLLDQTAAAPVVKPAESSASDKPPLQKIYTELLNKFGFTKTEEYSNGNVIFSQGDLEVVVEPKLKLGTFDWSTYKNGKMEAMGTGNWELAKSLDPVAEAPTRSATSKAASTSAQPKPLKSGLAKKSPAEIQELIETKQYDYAYQALDALAPHITDAERYALTEYKGDGYSEMNECMRIQENCNDHQVKLLEAWLAKAKTPAPLKLTRRVKGPFADAMYSMGTVGMRWRERGFLSTSLDPTPMSGWGNLTMEIHVPKGMPGTTVDNNDESEVLFNRGVHLKIKSFDRNKKYMVVEMDAGED